MIVTVEPSTFGGEESAYFTITLNGKARNKVMLATSVPDFLDRLVREAEARGIEVEVTNSL